jgi:hypothetical protein
MVDKALGVLATIRHPNLCTLYGETTSDLGIQYAVLEYAQHNLFDIIYNRTMHLEDDTILSIIRNVACGACNSVQQPPQLTPTPLRPSSGLSQHQVAGFHRRQFRPFPEAHSDGIVCIVALGMNYLHLMEPPVLHGNLKTANVLVDGNFVGMSLSPMPLPTNTHTQPHTNDFAPRPPPDPHRCPSLGPRPQRALPWSARLSLLSSTSSSPSPSSTSPAFAAIAVTVRLHSLWMSWSLNTNARACWNG